MIPGHRAYRSDWYMAMATDGGDPAAIVRTPTFNDPGLDGAFGPGETVEISFVFSKPVEVDTTGGTPSVEVLLSGATPVRAQFERGSVTLQLVFCYTLADGDGTHRSLLLGPNSLPLNGGTIRDTGNGLDTAVEHEGAGIFFLDAEARFCGRPRWTASDDEWDRRDIGGTLAERLPELPPRSASLLR